MSRYVTLIRETIRLFKSMKPVYSVGGNIIHYEISKKDVSRLHEIADETVQIEKLEAAARMLPKRVQHRASYKTISKKS